MQRPDGRGGPHLLVEDLERPEPDPDQRHHVERVLRVRVGDPVTVSDGRGRWRPCRWGMPLDPVGEVVEVRRPTPSTTVGVAVLKSDRPELIVRKLTELGVDRITLLATDRGVVRWTGERAASQLERLRRVAAEALEQSRGVWRPALEGPVPLAEAIGPTVALAVPGGAPLPGDGSVSAVLVGPEGGWTDDELALCRVHVGLGPSILRAETAAIAAGVVLTALRGGWLPVTGDLP